MQECQSATIQRQSGSETSGNKHAQERYPSTNTRQEPGTRSDSGRQSRHEQLLQGVQLLWGVWRVPGFHDDFEPEEKIILTSEGAVKDYRNRVITF